MSWDFHVGDRVTTTVQVNTGTIVRPVIEEHTRTYVLADNDMCTELHDAIKHREHTRLDEHSRPYMNTIYKRDVHERK